MKTIWKAALKLTGVQEINIPMYAEFLTAREQHGELCVWFMCDTTQPKVKCTIAIVGTGFAEVQDNARYIGTGFLRNGHLVLHIFDQTPRTGVSTK